MNLSINGLTIRQKEDGSVEVNSRPTHINCSPVTGAVSIRTHTVDMGVQVCYFHCGLAVTSPSGFRATKRRT